MARPSGSVDFYETISGRRSIRKYEESVRISRAEIAELIQEATLAPSANNLQTWRFLVIDDPELQKQVLPLSNQHHVVEASALIIVFADRDALSEVGRERIYSRAVEAGKMTPEAKEASLAMLRRGFVTKSEAALHDTLVINSSLAAMQLMLAARARGYDTVPMTGYDVAAFRKLFAIPDHLVNVLMIALGKAVAPATPTFRLRADELISWNSVQPL